MAEKILSRYDSTFVAAHKLAYLPELSFPLPPTNANESLFSILYTIIGLDLQGNTYWEFRDVRGNPSPNEPPPRWRRIVEYPRNTHYGEVKVPPQWHQWLRHLRQYPPTIKEQHAEVRRQQQIKYLAAQADARWEAKPRVMDPPKEEQGQQGQLPVDISESQVGAATKNDAGGEEQAQVVHSTPKSEKEDPWKKQRRAGPSEDWQPQAWAPPGASKR